MPVYGTGHDGMQFYLLKIGALKNSEPPCRPHSGSYEGELAWGGRGEFTSEDIIESSSTILS